MNRVTVMLAADIAKDSDVIFDLVGLSNSVDSVNKYTFYVYVMDYNATKPDQNDNVKIFFKVDLTLDTNPNSYIDIFEVELDKRYARQSDATYKFHLGIYGVSNGEPQSVVVTKTISKFSLRFPAQYSLSPSKVL